MDDRLDSQAFENRRRAALARFDFDPLKGCFDSLVVDCLETAGHSFLENTIVK